jgi:hypothetical protein
MADINIVAQQTSELLTDYANLLRTWFTMFYDPTPQDITLRLYDDEGNLQSYTFPNRSKDFTYILNGSGTPQGIKTAVVGSIYQDILNGEVYIKNSISTDTNWTKVISKEVLDTYIIQGNNAPEGNIFSTKGVLYVDLINCGLYIKTTSSGNTGWINIGGSVSIATKISLGSVQIGDNIDVDTNGVISSPLATDSIFGVIKTGTGITAVDGVISVTGGDADTLDGKHASEFITSSTGFMKRFYYNDTGVNPVVSSVQNFAHGLSETPENMIPVLQLKCTSPEWGFSAGDVITAFSTYQGSVWVQMNGILTTTDFSISNSISIDTYDANHLPQTLTPSKWTWVITIIGVGV